MTPATKLLNGNIWKYLLGVTIAINISTVGLIYRSLDHRLTSMETKIDKIDLKVDRTDEWRMLENHSVRITRNETDICEIKSDIREP